MARKHLIWAIPLLLLVLVILAGVMILPAFVAAPAHRATIEDFASRLTGRTVHISGKLSLSYLPLPDITATGITITGPDHQLITARALSLDLSPAALLHGQFGVRTLRLDAPVISLPWPIPGGINDIAPPPWLAALHAQISNGQIRIGSLDFTGVEADLLTGAGGRVRVAGTGQLYQRPVTLDLSVGQTASLGGTPLSAYATFANTKATMDGTLDANSQLDGQLSFHTDNNITGALQIQLTGRALNVSSLALEQGQARLNGSAWLDLKPLRLTARLIGQNLELGDVLELKPLLPENLPVQAELSLANVTIAGRVVATAKTVFVASPEADALTDLSLGTDGGANLRGNIRLARDGGLSGQLSLMVPDVQTFLAGLGLPPETMWTTAVLRTQLQGTQTAPHLAHISGVLGRDHVDGDVFILAHHAAFRLNFNHLALIPLTQALQQVHATRLFSAEGELTATQAEAGPIRLSNLFVDASFDNGLNIRRATANIYGGIVGGSMALNSQFEPISAHLFAALPDAAPLVMALFPHLKYPRAALSQPLNLIAAAAGSPASLSVATVIGLGNLTLTATPLIDLTTRSAQGALSLRTADAIDAFKKLGLVNGCSRMQVLKGYPFQVANQPCLASANNPGLAFPGPGSLSLRAYVKVTPSQLSLTDFVANAGLLNASGWLTLQKDHLTGQINAGTLAFPSLPTQTPVPDQLPISGQIKLSAEKIIYAGHDSFGPLTATLNLAPDAIGLSALKAGLGGGTVSGGLSLTLPPTSMPILKAQLVATAIDASTLNISQPFPVQLTSGLINATANLSASGYTAKTWAATLSGNVTLNAENGELNGLSLPNIAAALKASAPLQAGAWMSRGSTPFTAFTVNANISQGNCTLSQATLTSPAGTLTAVGGIDLFDQSLALRLEAHPAVHPPLTLVTRLIGSWAQPSQTTDISAARTWHAASTD